MSEEEGWAQKVQKLYSSPSFTCPWVEYSHMVMFDCKGIWEMWSSWATTHPAKNSITNTRWKDWNYQIEHLNEL